MWRCSRPQWLSPESTRFSAEHLIGSSCNRKKANEIFHNLSSCDTRSINELVSGAILHKLQLVQPMIYDYIRYYSVYTAKPTLASQVLLNSCAQTLNIWDPEYQKNYFYWRVKSYPYGILLLPTTSDTPLDIFSGFLKCHGYEFIFKKERNLLDRKGIITFMIFVSIQIHCRWWS